MPLAGRVPNPSGFCEGSGYRAYGPPHPNVFAFWGLGASAPSNVRLLLYYFGEDADCEACDEQEEWVFRLAPVQRYVEELADGEEEARGAPDDAALPCDVDDQHAPQTVRIQAMMTSASYTAQFPREEWTT